MKSPDKGGVYTLDHYGEVLVTGGPSPEEPFVRVKLLDDDEALREIHIETFHTLRVC